MPKHNKKLKQIIIEIATNQLNKNNPPETRKVVKRLMGSDPTFAYHEAVERIATVLSEEMYEMMKNKTPFNEERYIKKLKELK